MTTQMATGFFVMRDLVVTNVHAIEGTTKLSIRTFSSFVKSQASQSLTIGYPLVGVTAFDSRNDLVLLKVSHPGVPLPLGKSDALKKGDPVYFVGYGHSSQYNGMMGVVIDPQRDRLFQIKVILPQEHVGPGYSGGPVLNSTGEVVGVVASAIALSKNESGNNKTFVNAIPVAVLRRLFLNSGQVEPLLMWQKRPQIRAYTKTLLGNAKSEKGHYKKGKAYYDCAIKLNAKHYYAFFNRGNVKCDLGDYRGAISDYDMTLCLNPEFVVAYFNRALAKEELGDYRGAISDYDALLCLIPEDAQTYFHRGYAKGELSNYRGAISDFNHVIRLNPKYDDVYFHRGYAKDELGDYRGAISDYDVALCLSPEDEDVHYNRALTKEKLGQQTTVKVVSV